MVDAAGVRLHVEVSGSGPPLMLIHGAAGVLQDFPNKLREELARTHTVIAVDRPGHGYSTHGPRFLDADANLAALRAALKALGHERATLVGHSYGAVLALRWALQAPAEVSAVVAIAPASAPYAAAARVGLLPVVTPVIGHVLAWTLLLPVGMMVARFTRSQAAHPQPVYSGPPTAARMFPLVATQFRAFAENAQRVHRDVSEQLPLYDQGRAPLLIVAGEGDKVTPPSIHAIPLPTMWGGPSELRLLPNAGHMLLRSHADEVIAAVKRAEELIER
jgi:pimeloyl-ACP methyl ester carboxylesterase